MRTALRMMLAIGLAIFVLLTIQLVALARAGGGNNYVAPPTNPSGSTTISGTHHGISSGYHVYGGGAAGGTAINMSPESALILFGGIALIALFFWWRNRRSSASGVSPAAAGPAAIDTGAVRTGLSDLSSRDPNFNQQVFLDRAQATFFALQNAWMNRNLEPARIYLSDGIYHRWKMQVDEMLAQRKRNVLDDLVIGGCTIAQVAGDANFDSITVRFDASAADYEVDDLNRMVSGDKKDRPFTEYWTFIRSKAARTRAGETAEITQCPNCGAPVSVNESGTCAYCKATVTTGQFGWVLDNITQASQWSAAA